MKTIALTLALLVAGAHVAEARPHRGLRAAQASPAKREQLKQRVQALRAWTLTTELQLDEITATRMAPILARFDDELGRLMQQHAAARRALDEAIARGDDRTINRIIDDVLAAQRARAQLEEQRFQELRRVLTPAQAARLMVVLPEIDRRIHKKLRRVLEERRRGRPGGPRQPNPFDDDDDDPTQPAP